MLAHEAAGDQLVPAPQKNLPNRILRAVDNAMHVSALPRALRPTLAEIVRYVPQDRPFDTVFAKKESIALRIHASVETVFRHLKALKAHGLIETLEQERKSRNGRFAISRIRLTHKAAALLGFTAMLDDVCADAVVTDRADLHQSIAPAAMLNTTNTPSSTRTDEAPNQAMATAENSVIHTPPHVKMTDGHTLTEPTISKYQLPQRTENRLPVDLAWMTGNGLSRAGIFCLMGLAKAKQKRLSDIVTVVEQRIRELKGGALFAYLAALCKGPTDFSAAAATERARVRAERLTNEFERKAAVFKERFKGVSLTNPAQTMLIVIDRRCAFAQVFNVGKVASTMPLTDLRPLIERVEAGQLVLATLAFERRFVGA